MSTTFLSDVLENLYISRFPNFDCLIGNIKNLALKAILNYRKYPSINGIENKYRHVSSFSYVVVNKADFEKEILNLNRNKTSQNSNMSTKVIKENLDILDNFLCTSFNRNIRTNNKII